MTKSKRFKGTETVLPKFGEGNDTAKIYVSPLGSVQVGIQKGGESHAGYSQSGRMIDLHTTKGDSYQIK